MSELIIPAIIVIIIMLFFIFFVFKNVIDRLNRNTKKYFVDKLQDYDYYINLKKQEIQELEEQIKKKQQEKEKIIEENPNILTDFKDQIKGEEQSEKRLRKIVEQEAIINVHNPEYREESFFNTYRSLKKHFKIDTERVIIEFLKEHANKQEQKEYEILIKFRKYFDSDTTYQCLTLTKQEQYEVIDSITKKKQKLVLGIDKYDVEDFDLIKFLESIDNRIKQIDPVVYVYVGSSEENYDYISENVKTYVYKNMIEGIIISYQGKIYDYSI